MPRLAILYILEIAFHCLHIANYLSAQSTAFFYFWLEIVTCFIVEGFEQVIMVSILHYFVPCLAILWTNLTKLWIINLNFFHITNGFLNFSVVSLNLNYKIQSDK